MRYRVKPSPESPVPTTTLTNWTVRGAWRDWTRLTFPTNFAFPVGLEWIHGVTLMSWGEVRRDLRTPLTVGDGGDEASTTGESGHAGRVTLPTPLAIVPGLSSVSYGMVSNCFRIAWQNAAPNRSTNTLVNAAIELYASGQSVITYGDSVVTNNAVKPEGYVAGNGYQTLDYTTNLTNWVGINEQNGRYMTSITVSQLPASGPCYVVCGTNRIEITSAGTYSFPCEVYDVVETCVYPTNVEYSLAYDDGYRGTGTSYRMVDVTAARTAAQPAARRMMLSTQSNDDEDEETRNYRLKGRRFRYMECYIVCTPRAIRGALYRELTTVTWCNLCRVVRKSYEATATDLSLAFHDDDAITVVLRDIDATIELLYEDQYGNYATGEFCVDVENRYDVPIASETNATVCVTNDLYITRMTATSGTTTETNTVEQTVEIPAGTRVYVAAFMATAEIVEEPELCQNDRVGWEVTSEDGQSFSGSASVYGKSDDLIAADNTNHLPGVGNWPIWLGGRVFLPPESGPLRLHLRAWAKNALDGHYETCVQVGVYPIVDGNTPGYPDWAEQ